MMPRVMFEKLKELFRNKIIVSIQPVPDSPLDRTDIIVAMAKAAENAGAPALRIEGITNVSAVAKAVSIPIIGIVKRDLDNSPCRITALIEDVEQLAKAGAKIIAFDATDRIRPISRIDILKAIKKENLIAMADCSCIKDGIWANENGVEIIGTTLSGYISGEIPKEPDYQLVEELAKLNFFVVAEGRYNSPEQVAKAIQLGAASVTVGSALTRLEVVTEWFLSAAKNALL